MADTMRIRKVTHPYAWELALARTDHANLTGQPLVERPFWYENTGTDQCYYDLFGCIGWPTEDTDATKGMPGYVAVIAVVKDARPIKEAWFRLMGEGESESIGALLSHVLRLRSEFGYGLHPGLLQTFWGDPDKHIMRLALTNEALAEKHDGEGHSILVSPPTDFSDPDAFNSYRRSFDEAIKVEPARFAFGGNSILKTNHRLYRMGDPAILAVGGLVHKLIMETPWMDQARENAFNVEDQND
jgi:rRNA maturation protein Nop10